MINEFERVCKEAAGDTKENHGNYREEGGITAEDMGRAKCCKHMRYEGLVGLRI